MFKPEAVLNRRRFVQSTGLATTGLVLGLSLPGCGRSGQPGASKEVVDTDLNAYIRISSDDSVSIVVPGAELGQGVYTSLPKIVAEELEADWDQVTVRLATADQAYANPNKKRQSTGNSDAVLGYFDVLRQTGAAAREMLIAAAAARLQVPADQCRAESGKIHHDESGRSLTFGEVADDAALLQVPEDPPLKDPAQYRLIGRSLPRKDTPMKVDGTAEFGADVRLDGQLFASIRTAPTFTGRVKSFDPSSIADRAGIVKAVEVENGVAVLASSFWEANTALDELNVEFEDEPNNTWSSEQISAMFAEALDGGPAQAFPGAKGDAPQVIDSASDVFEATYEVPFLAHVCMEPMVATAQVTENECRIWAPSQQQGAARALAAELTGLPIEQVTLQGTFCGGGFGRKWELDFVRQAVLIAMQGDGLPVTLTWSREEDVRHDYYRPAVSAKTRAVLGDGGELVAMHTRLTGPSLLSFQGRPMAIPDPTVVGYAISPFYQIPNTLIEFAERNTHVPVGFWRSVALSSNGFIHEAAIDELAHRAGQDPVEFRLKLLGENERAKAVLERAAVEAGWGKALPPGKGMGVAFSPGFGSFNAQIAEVTVDDNRLTIDRITCVHDCGFAIDPDTVLAQMEGGLLDGLSSALFGEITIADGAVEQGNFDRYRMLRMSEAPSVDVHLISGDAPLGGVGEAATPGAGPAVANAIFQASGNRIRRLPITRAGFSVG